MNIEIYGCIKIGKSEYIDEDILKLAEQTTLPEYGKNGWTFSGDQCFEDSNIWIKLNDCDPHLFEGKTALLDACKYIRTAEYDPRAVSAAARLMNQ